MIYATFSFVELISKTRSWFVNDNVLLKALGHSVLKYIPPSPVGE